MTSVKNRFEDVLPLQENTTASRPKTLAGKKYSFDDQLKFAELSGDYNPLHLDPAVARRELFGEVVVHGIRVLLDGLDLIIQKSMRPEKKIWISSIRCMFQNPVFLNVPVIFTCDEPAPENYHLEARGHNGSLLVESYFSFSSPQPQSLPKISALAMNSGKPPAMLSIQDIKDKNGIVELNCPRSLAAVLFPHISKVIAPVQVAELLSLTRLVGMECPGLRSVLSSFELHSTCPVTTQSCAHYKVVAVNERFLKADIEMMGPSMKGVIKTFVRPGPQKQPSFGEVRKKIDPGILNNHTALIIGGTRGIGEITAKIIAAGGGYPVITYFSGVKDAEKLKNEILAQDGNCATIPFDVTKPGRYIKHLKALTMRFSAIYYFATPKIFVKKGSAFDNTLFKNFNKFYVSGLYNTYTILRKLYPHPMVLFNPSSVAIDEKIAELMEYALSKKASEDLCSYLTAKDKNLKIVTKRLPRIATDQTITITNVPAAGALEVMLPIVKEMHLLLEKLISL